MLIQDGPTGGVNTACAMRSQVINPCTWSVSSVERQIGPHVFDCTGRWRPVHGVAGGGYDAYGFYCCHIEAPSDGRFVRSTVINGDRHDIRSE